MKKILLIFFFSITILSNYIFFFTLPLFAQQVDTAWVRRYNGTGNFIDRAYAIAVDYSKNVYVTGSSSGSGSLDDYATIKYYHNGDTAWVRRYSASVNLPDRAYGIVVDDSDYVYVSGYSYDSLTNFDYATIKYSPDGETSWVRRYNGPGNSDDYAYAIAVDGSGNVYVTGSGQGNGLDCATIKYYSNGDTAWVRRYDGPVHSDDYADGIAVDSSGNVYITGFSWGSGTGRDYVTIKYNLYGDELWVRRYDMENSDDYAYSIAVDGSGNVYVTGVSYGSGTSYDYATIKYDPAGKQLWVKRYNGPPGNSYDWASAIAVDSSGNVYVTGSSYGIGTDWDYATIKYDTDGKQLWVKRYNGPGNSEDESNSIAIDDSGNVYVTGYSPGSGTSRDYVTLKYDADGNQLWVKRYNGPGNSDDGAYAIAVDGSGNVYVTGESYGSGTYHDYATIKYVQFLSGDVNFDSTITVEDVIYLIDYLFRGGPTPLPILQVGDVNCNGQVTVTDIIYLINYLFKSGPPPAC